MSRPILFLFFVLFSCAAVEGLRCYNCSSYTSPSCQTNKPANDTLVDCPAEDKLCRKTVQVVVHSDTKIVTRSCGRIVFANHPGNYCMQSNTETKKEVSCQCFEDECNTAERVGRVLPVLVIALLFSTLNFL